MPLIDDDAVALAVRLGERMRAKGWRVVTAESCTGGLVAGTITAIAGSSEWFERAFVTYADAAKAQMLDVPQALLETHGAVSEPVAVAMAEGALKRSTADVAVAITGVAGPGGGTPAKPVGMVCFGWARRGRPGWSVTRQLPGDRNAVRAASVTVALEGLVGEAEKSE